MTKLLSGPFEEAHRPAIEHIARNMREWDRREVYATRWDDDPVALASSCIVTNGFGWIACLDDGEPVAVMGAHAMWPGVWSVWCFGTDKFRQVGHTLTKMAKRVMIPTLANSMGVHRAEARSMEGHDVAHRWLESLGATRESRLPRLGRNKEDFWLYVWER